MDHCKAKDRNHIGKDSHNDTADTDGHRIIGNSAEDLPAHHNVDDGKATSDENIEDRCQFSTPETKGVSRAGDLAQSKLSCVISSHTEYIVAFPSPLVPMCLCKPCTTLRGTFQRRYQRRIDPTSNRILVPRSQWVESQHEQSPTTI